MAVRKIIWCLSVGLLSSASLLLVCESAAHAREALWAEVKSEVVHQLNSDMKAGMPTVDIGIYYPSNLDQAFTDQFSVDDLLAEFARAKNIFSQADVQLNLLWIKTGRINESFLEIQSNDMSAAIPGGLYTNMYENGRPHPSVLSSQALNAMESESGHRS